MRSRNVHTVWVVEGEDRTCRKVAALFKRLDLFSARVFSSCDELLTALRSETPRLILVEAFAGATTTAKIKRIKAAAPRVNVIMLTSCEDSNAPANLIPDSLYGLVPQSSRMKFPVSNHYALSTRERQILQLMVKGLINKEIAEALSISYFTVENHQRKIYEKLTVHTRTAAVAKALLEKIVEG